jgi:hypothetical protein
VSCPQCEENILEEYGLPSSKQRKGSLDEQDVSLARARLPRPSLPYNLSSVSSLAAIDTSCALPRKQLLPA